MNLLKNPKPYLIAITGSIGVGKSTVGDILKEHGVYVIDSDDIVRDILKSKNQITLKIVKGFGDVVLNNTDNYFINKNILSEIIFNNEDKRKYLESIIHPEVRHLIARLISMNNNKQAIAVLIPLLFEGNLESPYDETWCVICQPKIQIERLIKKGYKEEAAKARISAQLSQEEKAKRANFVIDNSEEFLNTKEQVLNKLKVLAQSIQSLQVFFCK